MSIIGIFILAVGLAMDAFAVSICKGLSMEEAKWENMIIVGAWFGGLQACMPLLGYLLGSLFQDTMKVFDHWVAFILLNIIGMNMICEAIQNNEKRENNSLKVRIMFMLALATSIDAFAVGITFAFLSVHVGWAVLIIGVVTFILSAIGVKIGTIFGIRYKAKAEIIGGIILILMGTKILLEHFGLF